VDCRAAKETSRGGERLWQAEAGRPSAEEWASEARASA